MDIIGKKVLKNPENIITGKNDITSNGLENIFAELFSLVDLSSEPKTIDNKSNLEFMIGNLEKEKPKKNIDNLKLNDDNALKAAKSLISIFFENNKFENVEKEIKTNNTSLDSKTNINILKNVLNENEKKTLEVLENKNFKHLNKNLALNSNISLDNKTGKKLKSIKDQIISLKDVLPNEKLTSERKKLSESHNQIANPAKKNSESLNQVSDKKKKIKDQNNQSIKNLKLEVDFLKTEKNIQTKSSIVNSFIKIKDTNKSNSNVNQSENIAKIRNNSKDILIKNNTNQFYTHENKEFLDMMESGWGEKFVKSLRNNLARGLQKIDISLEPKNLGKLKVEVEMIDNKTKVKINADNKITAKIFEENQLRLSEMLDKEDLKFENFSSMSFNQQSKGNNKNDKNTNNQSSSINKIDSDKNIKNKIKKNEHNIDINA